MSVILYASAPATLTQVPAALGPTPPAGALSVVLAQSRALCTWQVTAGTGVLPLVPAWGATAAKLVGEPCTNDSGKVYRCITAGTTAGSGGPTGTSTDITDGTVHWAYVGPAATAFGGGFVAVNIDDTSIVYYGTSAAPTTTKASGAIYKSGGSISLSCSPALLNVVAGAGAVITVTALV